jgi:flagellar basal-body rod protein FlgF
MNSMGSVVEIGAFLISDASRRLESNALNIANVNTHGYKAVRPFPSHLLKENGGISAVSRREFLSQLEPGQIRQTGNPLDLAISGAGYFILRSAAGEIYSRAGQFRKDADGRLVAGEDWVLQGAGGDVAVRSEVFEILPDGTVLDDGEPVARIELADFADPSLLRRAGVGFASDAANVVPASSARLVQGALETSNVSLVGEVMSMMQLQRSAETGRQLVQVYDDLLGRALNSLGQA